MMFSCSSFSFSVKFSLYIFKKDFKNTAMASEYTGLAAEWVLSGMRQSLLYTTGLSAVADVLAHGRD